MKGHYWQRNWQFCLTFCKKTMLTWSVIGFVVDDAGPVLDRLEMVLCWRFESTLQLFSDDGFLWSVTNTAGVSGAFDWRSFGHKLFRALVLVSFFPNWSLGSFFQPWSSLGCLVCSYQWERTDITVPLLLDSRCGWPLPTQQTPNVIWRYYLVSIRLVGQ